MVKRLRSPDAQEKIRRSTKAKAKADETTGSPSKVLEPSLDAMLEARANWEEEETVDQVAPREALWSDRTNIRGELAPTTRARSMSQVKRNEISAVDRRRWLNLKPLIL